MRKYIYADESGNLDFSQRSDASQTFILTTVLIDDHSIESELLELRRELSWNGIDLTKGFHANNDSWRVRETVFDVLSKHNFRVDATILEKRKAHPGIRLETRFYQHAWYFHMNGVASKIASSSDELFVISSSIGAGKKRTAFYKAVSDVVQQTSPTRDHMSVMWPAESTPCLQVADYCSWAIYRKWERTDNRFYDLIKDKIETEFDLFGRGNIYYY